MSPITDKLGKNKQISGITPANIAAYYQHDTPSNRVKSVFDEIVHQRQSVFKEYNSGFMRGRNQEQAQSFTPKKRANSSSRRDIRF